MDYFSQYRFLFEPEEFLPDVRYNSVTFELVVNEACVPWARREGADAGEFQEASSCSDSPEDLAEVDETEVDSKSAEQMDAEVDGAADKAETKGDKAETNGEVWYKPETANGDWRVASSG